MEKLKKEPLELNKQFLNSISFLKELVNVALSKNYNDPLREEYAKAIAVKLRVLLIDSASNSLVKQLNISDRLYFPPLCVKFNDLPGNLIQTFGLAGERISEKESYYFSNYSRNESELRCSLMCWLDEIVFDRKQAALHKISRKDIILDLADKEGGAHVDPSYEEEYYHIVYESGSCLSTSDGRIIKALNNRFAEAVLTIAQEFIEAIDEFFAYINGSSQYLCENDLTLIELIYEDKNFRKKYMHNQQKNINATLMWSYDYMNIADYKLIFSRNYLFVKDSHKFFIRVIDDSNSDPVLFCINKYDVFVFVKRRKYFYLIQKDEDLYSIETQRHYTYSQAMALIKKSEYANLDCLNKQRICIEHNKVEND